jgi:hypothetical protein
MTSQQVKSALPLALGALAAGILGYKFELMTGETAFMVAAIGSIIAFASARRPVRPPRRS